MLREHIEKMEKIIADIEAYTRHQGDALDADLANIQDIAKAVRDILYAMKGDTK